MEGLVVEAGGMQEEVAVFNGTRSELALLAALAGVPALVGVPDPFDGWLRSELEAAWERVRPELAARGLIVTQADGAAVLAPTVADLLQTCGSAHAVLTLTRVEPGQPQQVRCIHIGSGTATHLELSDDGFVRLSKLAAPEDIRHAVMAHLQQPGEAPLGNGDPCRLPAAVLKPGATLPSLLTAGADPATAERLAKTLAEPVANCAVLLTKYSRGTWETTGLGVLEGGQRLWLLHAVPGPAIGMIEMTASTLEQVQAALAELLDPVLEVWVAPA